MSEDLKQLIKEFNEIKYPNDNETRIIIATLKLVKPLGLCAITSASNIN